MGSKVLLADDSVTIQKVVGIIFANEDYDLTIVASGDEAVRKAVEINPDVMLVDALMPGKNGYEVCREIRQNPQLRHVGILLMTGAFEVVDEEKSRQSGADEFIVKPFESQTLIDATNRMIALTAGRAGAAAHAPAAPQQVQAAPVASPAANTVVPPSVDDVWASGFDMEPAAEIRPEPAFAAPPVSPTPVKATAADDLWGAFDMDSFEEPSPPVQAAVPTPIPVAPAPADDFFSFETDTPQPPQQPPADPFDFGDVVEEAPEPAVSATATGFEPVGEQEIFFGSEEPAPLQQVQAPPANVEDDFSTISFDEPESVPPAQVPPPQPPVVETAPPVPPVFPVVPPSAAAALSAAPAAPDEAQLRALLSSASREVIEKIVWEVVPDLAESIIREEIRKLKAGIA